MPWQSIETAPHDGSLIVCWAKDWPRPALLEWKTNRRIVDARRLDPDSVGTMFDSYFGDPVEWDDYDMAKPNGQPTHWHPLDPFPVLA